MNKILMTGLGVAKEFGICNSCNIDYSWLVNNPSIILWADKLCIPRSSFDSQIALDDYKSDKVINMFLKMAEEHDALEKLNISSMYQESVGDQLYQRMLNDSKALLETFPENIRKGDEGVWDEIVIENEGYCGPWMSAVYASLKLAGDIDANCLFSRRDLNFLKYIYGLETNSINKEWLNKAYTEVFSLFIPEKMNLHTYAFSPEEKCNSCIHYDDCKEKYLTDSEEVFSKLFEWREYDEIQQAKEEIDKIIRRKSEISSQKDIDEVVKEFKQRQETINRNINKRFPKINRWAKMTMVLSTPFTIAAGISGNIPLTIGSGIATGLATAVEKILETYRSKNCWVGFLNELKND